MEMVTEQKRYLSDINEVRKRLENTLLEKTALEHRLNTEFEKARGMQDLERLLVEKEQVEHRLDNTLVDLQEKEKQVAELEDIHTQKIKQLVHDFEKQLAEKDEKLMNLENKMFGKYWRKVTFQYRIHTKHVPCFRML
jgi:chromosome segregation ATPase